MDLIYFFLDITWVEAIVTSLFLSFILTVPIYTRLIGAICFMFCIIFVFFGFVIDQGGDREVNLFPPRPYYVEKVVKKYELQEFLYSYPSGLKLEMALKSSTMGFGICLLNKYEGSICSGYLKYFENKLIGYKNEILEKRSEGKREDKKAYDEAIERQRNIDNHFN
ncbi:hypothetical protein C4Q04_08430 [Campylobacter coli]|uniref:hypothetical protein n=1 Tax=Campylobacter jejuni TaxID=197 RepID=UPI000C2857CD|nr:hypothetical protein [Campylobacter jejuni]EAI5870721.1 hypothetical protein [Campylobacter coli]EAI9764979.1 hypothetical protein [Campylobacter coli]EAK7460206.1 hypothetical protein [Campylobacter coli]MIA22399.1 hypothetical protein [Campylobacter coli]PJP47055.1 hypothetical protein CV377_09510 [Campylobacter jejuni subsp. jejuni]